MKKFIEVIKVNKKAIIKRTLIVGGVVVAIVLLYTAAQAKSDQLTAGSEFEDFEDESVVEPTEEI